MYALVSNMIKLVGSANLVSTFMTQSIDMKPTEELLSHV
jgi:hypothetical protein